jgi:hypothetical protein
MADLLLKSGAPAKGGHSAIAEQARSPIEEMLPIPRGCTLTRTSLTLPESTTKEEWETIGATLTTMKGAVQFWIGDWLRFGEERKYIRRNKYDEAMKQTGMKRGTLKVYASVAKNIPSSMRINQLSFQHHQLVAGQSEDEKASWLERAVDEEMTVRELRAAISASDPRTARTHDEELADLKARLLRLVEPYDEWPELEGVLSAIDAIDTESPSN